MIIEKNIDSILGFAQIRKFANLLKTAKKQPHKKPTPTEDFEE